jgi:hypothetical protein
MANPIHWTKTMGNKYLADLHPSMLSGCYQTTKTLSTSAGKLPYSPPRREITVTYDRDYVVQKLARVLRPIIEEDNQELQLLLHQALQVAKEQKRQAH